jgi:DNA-binding NarL/FixJ family response regulator
MTPHVLVVDDDKLFAEMITALLEEDGRLAVVGQAADGREAVELTIALSPDVVLMDLHMPVLDGLEATRRIRRLRPDTRVVVITSSTAEEDRRHARETGAHIFLPKGVGAEALVEAVLTVAQQAVAR